MLRWYDIVRKEYKNKWPSSCVLEKSVNSVCSCAADACAKEATDRIRYAKTRGTNQQGEVLVEDGERVRTYTNAEALAGSRPLGAIIVEAGSEHLPCLGPGGEVRAYRVV